MSSGIPCQKQKQMNKRLLSEAMKYITVGGVTITYYEFINSQSARPGSGKALQVNIENLENQISNLTKNLSSNLDTETKSKIIELIRSIKGNLQILKKSHTDYVDKFESDTVSNNPESSHSFFEEFKGTFSKVFENSKNKAEELENLVEKTKTNFMDDNFILNIINYYREYLSHLSITELCLIINILSCFLIILCFLSILFAL